MSSGRRYVPLLRLRIRIGSRRCHLSLCKLADDRTPLVQPDAHWFLKPVSKKDVRDYHLGPSPRSPTRLPPRSCIIDRSPSSLHAQSSSTRWTSALS